MIIDKEFSKKIPNKPNFEKNFLSASHNTNEGTGIGLTRCVKELVDILQGCCQCIRNSR